MNQPIIAEHKTARKSRSTYRRNELLQPFLKWAGGKRQLVPVIRQYIPSRFKIYFEPFVGAGAVLFDLQPVTSLINDANTELINCYRVIKESPDELIELARQHQNREDYYYRVRSLDRDPTFKNLSPVERASRIIFLNKTCYNGLFRVNSQGQFNVPFGKYSNPVIVDEIVIRAVSHYLNSNQVQISNDDFESALSSAGRNDFVYLDPPYDPLSDTSSFTGYNLNSFGREEQLRLRKVYDDLTSRGCKLLLSNSATEFIRELYSDNKKYSIFEVEATRNINSVASSRGKISELLIHNYDAVEK
jgi:DNA adenine methylase